MLRRTGSIVSVALFAWTAAACRNDIGGPLAKDTIRSVGSPGALAARASEPAPPRIEVVGLEESDVRVDLGLVSAEIPAAATLTIRNAGGDSLDLTMATASSGIVSVHIAGDRTLAAGESTKLSIERDPRVLPVRAGPFRHAIRINSNDPSTPVLEFALTGEQAQLGRIAAPSPDDFVRSDRPTADTVRSADQDPSDRLQSCMVGTWLADGFGDAYNAIMTTMSVHLVQEHGTVTYGFAPDGHAYVDVADWIGQAHRSRSIVASEEDFTETLTGRIDASCTVSRGLLRCRRLAGAFTSPRGFSPMVTPPNLDGAFGVRCDAKRLAIAPAPWPEDGDACPLVLRRTTEYPRSARRSGRRFPSWAIGPTL